MLGLCLGLLLLATGLPAATVPPVQTVFVILLENNNWSAFKGSASAPYLNGTLLPAASHCEQYYNPPGIHPSEPNYIWFEAATNFGVFNDADPAINHFSTTNHLSALLTRAGISWKSYQEDIDGTYVPLTSTNNYAPKHNPMVFFDDVTGTNNRANAFGIAHIRPYTELATDLANNTVPRYCFITPNQVHDGHDAVAPSFNVVRQTDDWLATEVPKITNSAACQNNGALFITWDEGISGDGPIGMIVLSPLARGGGYFNNRHYTHSSLVRTLQDIFAVNQSYLNDAANATDLFDLFTPFGVSGTTNPVSGGFDLLTTGVIPGRTNVVQVATVLTNWSSISTNTLPANALSNQFRVTDANAAGATSRFYRVLQLP